MKRIKRILCVFLLVISLLILSGCKKDYSSITYKRFTEVMRDELEYTVVDNSIYYQDKYQRELTAAKENIVFVFYEFKDSNEAKEYMNKNYKKKKYYSYKVYDDYSIVKYSKSGYVKIIQVDNIIISGSSLKDGNKSAINKVFKELGY